MEKSIFTKDYLVSRVITSGKQVDGYSNVYYKANEDLIDYLDTDFEDKDVLSVLASSDQVLTARLLDAKTVDAFDFNRLTLYYFYLRIWSLKYANLLYPDVLDNNKWLTKLLTSVKPKSPQEQKALEFFKLHIKDNTKLSRLFYDIDAQPIGKTLYTKPEELSDCLDPNLTFYHLDLFKPFDINKTYDILLISNILEWARGDKQKLRIAYENLSKLLNKDGTIICTHLINSDSNTEQDIFSNGFIREQNNTTYTYKKR